MVDNFSILLMKRASVLNFNYRNSNSRLDLQSQKITSLRHTLRIALKIQRDIFVYRFDFNTTNLASFPLKSLNYAIINFYLHEMSTSIVSNFTTIARIDNTLQRSPKQLRAITMCSTFIPDRWYDTINIIITGNVHSPNERSTGKLWVHSKSFENLSRSEDQYPQVTSCVRCGIFLVKNKQISFPWSVTRGFIF